jgi:hypothetical protein
MDLAVGNFGRADWYGSVSNPSLIFKNNGGQNFTEVHKELGVKFFENNAGVMWADLDLDGNLDLWHSQYAENPAGGDEPQRLSRVYMNGGAENNYAFKDKTWELGAEIHGAWTQARTDFDNDGDIDILAASPHDGVRLFRNDMERKGNWIGFRIAIRPTLVLNSVIKVYAGGKVFKKEFAAQGGGATASQSTQMIHFGLGDVNKIDSIHLIYDGVNFHRYNNYNYIPVNNTSLLMYDPGPHTPWLNIRVLETYNPPGLINPRNTAVLKNSTVELKWSKTFTFANAEKYTSFNVQISNNESFSTFVLDTIITDTSEKGFTGIIANLPPNQKFYWRTNQLQYSPQTGGRARVSPWSSVWSFTTGDATSVENEVAFKNDLLKEASPNPVVNKTMIDFTVEKAGAVSLKIFDLEGTEVATLADGNYEPGDYSEIWNAENIPSGTYYYVLKTATGSVSKKLVVQK